MPDSGNISLFDKVLLVGLQSSYDSLVPDENKLYFCYDTCNIYKGGKLYTDAIRLVEKRPGRDIRYDTSTGKEIVGEDQNGNEIDENGNIVPAGRIAVKKGPPIAVGKLYFIIEDQTIEFHDGNGWHVCIPKIATEISEESGKELVTADVLYLYMKHTIEDMSATGLFVTDVLESVLSAGDNPATFKKQKGPKTTEITIPGVIHSPTYDSLNGILSLPVTKSTPIVVNLSSTIQNILANNIAFGTFGSYEPPEDPEEVQYTHYIILDGSIVAYYAEDEYETDDDNITHIADIYDIGDSKIGYVLLISPEDDDSEESSEYVYYNILNTAIGYMIDDDGEKRLYTNDTGEDILVGEIVSVDEFSSDDED